MKTVLVQDYMSASPHSIGVTLTLEDAKNMMRAHHIRHLPVLDGGKLVGVVSDRDVQMVESMDDVESAEVPIEEAMSQAPYTASPTTPLEVAARHMSRHRLGSVVVLHRGQVVGVLTTTDGMRALADVLAGSPSAPRPPKTEAPRSRPAASRKAAKPAAKKSPARKTKPATAQGKRKVGARRR